MVSIECQICMEGFQSNQIDKVPCGSSVDHMVCFDCEKQWRNKMPLQDGVRIMKCPTCRQPEQYRTTASLQREARTTSPPMSIYDAQVAAEMAQALQIVRVLRRREEDRVAARLAASSAVARASAPSRRITHEEADAINARLMGPAEAAPDGTQDSPVVVDADRPRPPRARCASGRNCHSTSQSGRSMTHLKCTQCNLVFCCRTCKECVGCRPIPYMSPY